MNSRIYLAATLVLISCVLLYMDLHGTRQPFQDSRTNPAHDPNKDLDIQLDVSHARALAKELSDSESRPETKKEHLWEYNDGADQEERLQYSLGAIGGLSKLRGNELHNGIANIVGDMRQLADAINENHGMFLAVESEKTRDSRGLEINARLMFSGLYPHGDPDEDKKRKEFWTRYRAVAIRESWAMSADTDRRTLLWALKGVLNDMVKAKTVTRDGADAIIRQINLPPGKLDESRRQGVADWNKGLQQGKN